MLALSVLDACALRSTWFLCNICARLQAFADLAIVVYNDDDTKLDTKQQNVSNISIIVMSMMTNNNNMSNIFNIMMTNDVNNDEKNCIIN